MPYTTPPPTMSKEVLTIITTVGERTHASPQEILSPSRERPFPYSRKLSVYFIRIFLPDIGCPHIAKTFGWKKKHEMVSQYYKQIKDQVTSEGKVRSDVREIESILKTLLQR